MLRNEEYSDRELLHIIMAASSGGLASSEEIADALGVSDNGRSKITRVSSRLSWMKRYGFIEHVDPPEQGIGRDYRGKLWRLTNLGQRLAAGRLSRSVETALERMDPGAQLLMMRSLSRRSLASDHADAVRREYQHNLAAARADRRSRY